MTATLLPTDSRKERVVASWHDELEAEQMASDALCDRLTEERREKVLRVAKAIADELGAMADWVI